AKQVRRNGLKVSSISKRNIPANHEMRAACTVDATETALVALPQPDNIIIAELISVVGPGTRPDYRWTHRPPYLLGTMLYLRPIGRRSSLRSILFLSRRARGRLGVRPILTGLMTLICPLRNRMRLRTRPPAI